MRTSGVIVAAVVAVALPAHASAATLTVDTLGDTVANDGHCSLREAITAADMDAPSGAAAGECVKGAGADTILLPAGRLLLTINGKDENNALGDLDLTSAITLKGAGRDATIIDGTDRDRVLDVKAGATVTVQDLTITGGHAPDGDAGGHNPAGTQGTKGGGGANGGGIRNNGTLTVLDSIVTGNQAGAGGPGGDGTNGTDSHGGQGGDGGDGGAISTTGPLTITGSQITADHAGAGGTGGKGTGETGAAAFGGTGGQGGQGTGGAGGGGGRGGGIAVLGGGTLTMIGTTLGDDRAGNGGTGGEGRGGAGGTGVGSGDTGGWGATGTGGVGGPGGAGGGIYAIGSTTLTALTVTGTTAGRGGDGGHGVGGDGGFAPTGTAGSGAGGAGGHAGGGGGVGGLLISAPLVLDASTIVGTVAGYGGTGGTGSAGSAGGFGGHDGSGFGGDGGLGGGNGGLEAAGGGLVSNVTIDGNRAGNGGAGGRAESDTGSQYGGDGGLGGDIGGLESTALGLTVVHATISSNNPGFGGAAGAGASPGGPGGPGVIGGVSRLGGTLTVTDSIVAGNGGLVSCSAGITDGGHNLRFPDTSCPGTTGDPGLAPLAGNGGATQTRAPASAGPAVDLVPPTGAGCLPLDQRGLPRPSGAACDAGAYEVTPPAASTGDATGITTASATVAGTVNPNGPATQVSFEYGTSTAYGATVAASAVGPGLAAAAVSAALTGLPQGTEIHYRVVATSADGTSVGADRTFGTAVTSVVAAASPDTTAPTISALKLDPSRFAVSSAATALTARKHKSVAKGSHIKFNLTEAATKVTLTIEKKSTHKSKHKHKTTTTYKKVGTLTRTGTSGSNSFAFSGRLGHKALATGSYRLTVVATDAAGNASKAKTASFTIAHSR